jgi:hypothetical protein
VNRPAPSISEIRAELLDGDMATPHAMIVHARRKNAAFAIVVESYQRSTMGRESAGKIAHGQASFSRFAGDIEKAARASAQIATSPNERLIT